MNKRFSNIETIPHFRHPKWLAVLRAGLLSCHSGGRGDGRRIRHWLVALWLVPWRGSPCGLD